MDIKWEQIPLTGTPDREHSGLRSLGFNSDESKQQQSCQVQWTPWRTWEKFPTASAMIGSLKSFSIMFLQELPLVVTVLFYLHNSKAVK